MERWIQILLATLVAILLLWVEHWGPWAALLRKQRLHVAFNYVLGTLTIQIPYLVLMRIWCEIEALFALMVITVGGGLAVIVAYLLDHYILVRARMISAEREADHLRPRINEDDQGA